MTDKKSSKSVLFAIIAVVFLLIVGGLIFTTKHVPDDQITEKQQTAAATGENISEPITTSEQAATTAEATPATETPAATQAAAPVQVTTVDVNAALSDRLLGSTSAPMRIAEHASLTCTHCAEFHEKTFAKLKKDYIDTNKAYMVFSDFPLNAPALKASMVARCLPKDKYFAFVQDLFVNQKDWAFDNNYEGYLQKKAVAGGLSEGAFKACFNNKEIETGIQNRMKGVQAQWNINSTPSFVINNRTTIAGAYAYEDFKKVLDEEYAKVTGGTPAAPAATSAKEAEPAPAAAKEEAPAAKEDATAADEETPAATEEMTTPEAEAPATEDDTPEAETPAAASPTTDEGAGAASKQPQE